MVRTTASPLQHFAVQDLQELMIADEIGGMRIRFQIEGLGEPTSASHLSNMSNGAPFDNSTLSLRRKMSMGS